MKQEKFLKRIGIEEKDFTAIADAVKQAEENTDGEIALAITRQSDDYSIYEMMLGMCIGFLTFLVCLPFTNQLNNFLNSLFWFPAEWYLPAFIGLIIFCTMGIFFMLANIPAIDRLIIPKSVRHRKVYDKMLIHFLEKGIYKTKNHSGILIFISVLERKVLVLADEGINSKLENDELQNICNGIIFGIKNKQAGKALCEAVKNCGELLAKNFPAKKENPNELPDGLVVI